MNAEDEKIITSAKSVGNDHGNHRLDRKRGSEGDSSPTREDLSGEEDSGSIDGKDSDDGYLTEGYSEEDDNDQQELDPAQNPVNTELPFYGFLCYRLEKLWLNKREKQTGRRWNEKQRLEYILPRKMLDSMNGHSIFPYLRLLLPEQDSRRQFRVKEKKIAEAYCKAQGFGKGTKNYEMLMVRNSRILHTSVRS